MIGLPCTLLEMVPGFLFGYKTGVFCNTFGKWLGSMISFGLARIFADKVDRWGRKHKAYRLCTKAVEKGRLWSLVSVRLLPAPMSLKNYGLGALGTPAMPYTIASCLCALPFAIVWTYFGMKCKSLAEVFASKSDSPKPTLSMEWIAIGAVGLVALFFLRKALYKQLPAWVREELESDNSKND